jgi:hypothetical protein
MAWPLFLAVCFHLVFFLPSPNLIPIPRIKIFSGVACAAALVMALIAHSRGFVFGRPIELWATAVLISLAILSGLLSEYPIEATRRSFVLWSSCAGGFWCARILLPYGERIEFLVKMSIPALAIVIGTSLISYHQRSMVSYYIDSNDHALAGKIFLLWIGPIWLILKGSFRERVVGWALILASCSVFYLSNLKIAVLIAPALLIMGAITGLVSLKRLFIIMIIASIPLTCFFMNLPAQKRFDPTVMPIFYRTQQYFLSAKIAMERPWLGIGLHAPRMEFIEDFEPVIQGANKAEFVQHLKTIRVSENIFLTFMSDLGFPFMVIYTIGLVLLVLKLFKASLAGRSRGPDDFSPILFLPVIAAIMHFLVWDGLLHPQEAWFFHVWLGAGRAGRIEK